MLRHILFTAALIIALAACSSDLGAGVEGAQPDAGVHPDTRIADHCNKQCRSHGACKYIKLDGLELCFVDTEAGCKASEACRKWGYCSMLPGCWPFTETTCQNTLRGNQEFGACANSVHCTKHGACNYEVHPGMKACGGSTIVVTRCQKPKKTP